MQLVYLHTCSVHTAYSIKCKYRFMLHSCSPMPRRRELTMWELRNGAASLESRCRLTRGCGGRESVRVMQSVIDSIPIHPRVDHPDPSHALLLSCREWVTPRAGRSDPRYGTIGVTIATSTASLHLYCCPPLPLFINPHLFISLSRLLLSLPQQSQLQFGRQAARLSVRQPATRHPSRLHLASARLVFALSFNH